MKGSCPLQITCHHCGELVDPGDARQGDWVECPRCEAEVQVPITAMKKRRSGSDDMPQVVFPVMLPTEQESELTEERIQDLRETRRYRNEDRAGNPVGLVGFAIGVTTFLLLAGAMVMYKALPVYLGFAACIGVPAALAGLMCSIIGSLLVGRPRMFSIIGAGIGGFLILIGLPLAFLLLKGDFR